MKYIIIIDKSRGWEYTSKDLFEEALSWYRDPKNGYLGRIDIFVELEAAE